MKKMNILVFYIFISIFLVCSCSREEKVVKLYYNKNTINKIQIIEKIKEIYERREGKEKIEIIAVENEDEILKYVGRDKESALVLLDRYAFIDFVNKDILRDLSYLYKQKDIREKLSIITNLYGRFNGKYYGFGIMPFSLELVYNKRMLEKLDIEINENNFQTGIKKLRDKNIKIPTYIESEYSKELLISNLIANDTIIYDVNETILTENIKNKIKSIRGEIIFEELNKLYEKGIFREENFIDGNKEIIDRFNKEEIPVMMITTLSSDKVTSKEGIGVINKLPLYNTVVNSPVGIDIVIASTIGNNKQSEIDRFFRFLFTDEAFKNLDVKNFVTGSKKLDSKLRGVQSKMAGDIHSTDEINKFYINAISNEDIWRIDAQIKKVMKGEYTGHEWETVISKN